MAPMDYSLAPDFAFGLTVNLRIPSLIVFAARLRDCGLAATSYRNGSDVVFRLTFAKSENDYVLR